MISNRLILIFAGLLSFATGCESFADTAAQRTTPTTATVSSDDALVADEPDRALSITLDKLTYKYLKAARALRNADYSQFERTDSMRRMNHRLDQEETRTFDDEQSAHHMNPVRVFAWKRHPSVTFNNIHETVIVDPRRYDEINTTPQDAANEFVSQAKILRDAGHLVAFRFWKELNVGRETALFDKDWWEDLSAYEEPKVSARVQSWWDDFNAAVIDSGITIDYLIHDLETGDFWSIPRDRRESYFKPITINNANNPYPYSPNPYIGKQIWRVGTNDSDIFIQDYRQWNVEQRSVVLRRLTGGLLPIVVDNQYSNYKDTVDALVRDDLHNRPLRQPSASTRLAEISAPSIYLNYNLSHSLTKPEPEYTTERERINRRRWKHMIYRLNLARSAMAFPTGRVDPWIAYPGFGRNGSGTSASAAQLPFEKMLWNLLNQHLFAMGIDTYILWNPRVEWNPNAEDTDAYCDAYFADRVVGAYDRTLSIIDKNADTITTGDFTSNYSDIFEIETLYFQRSVNNPVPYIHGLGTKSNPLIISTGNKGRIELQRMVVSIGLNQDTTINIQEVPSDD